MTGAKHWVFTLNNYTDDEFESIKSIREKFSYCICGKEVGETGVPHLQGFVTFFERRSLAAIKKLPGFTRCHLEIRKGTALQASEYCKKEKNFWEWGSLSDRGQRNDLQQVSDALLNGASIESVCEHHPVQIIKFHRGIQFLYEQIRNKPRDFRTQVIWLWGATGTGKSRTAHSEAKELSNGDYCTIADNSMVWFNPYAGHRICVLDDFAGEASLAKLLRLWDRYPMQVPIKGNFVQWRPRIVYVTSNFSPASLYADTNPRIRFRALCRRIDVVIQFNADFSQIEQSGAELFSSVYPELN